jgi:hypothetical protein
MHKDTRQIELDLETDLEDYATCQSQCHFSNTQKSVTHIDVGTIDRGGPPQRETPIRDLRQTGPLRIGELKEQNWQ